MLELDNLDLDLDEDFPSGPFNNINFSQGTQKTSNIFKHFQKPLQETVKNTKQLSDNSKTVADETEGHASNSSKEINSTKRILTQRKFPGPAGLLPDKPFDISSDVNIIVGNSLDNITSECEKDSVILCSQASSIFSEQSFKSLAADFDLNNSDCTLSKFTIDCVKKKALSKSLCGKKIPFMAVVLTHLDHSTPDPVLTLKDATGVIYGSLHREVWTELGEKLHPGASLALRQVGVLVTGITRRQVYLNITINNIVSIYSYSEEETISRNVINETTKEELMSSMSNFECGVSNSDDISYGQLFQVIGKTANYSRNFPAIQKTTKRLNVSHNQENCNNYSQNCTSDFNLSVNEVNLNDDLVKVIQKNHLSYKLKSQEFKDYSSENISFNRDTNRKRKIDIGRSSVETKLFGEEIQRKLLAEEAVNKQKNIAITFGNHPLSQAESQIVEEVLDGINFDDF